MATVRKQPLRRCVGCMEMKNKRELVRVVRTPEGDYRLDATGRLNGRGAYLCPRLSCLEAAVKNHGLDRSFKAPVPRDIYEKLTEEMKTLGQENQGQPGQG